MRFGAGITLFYPTEEQIKRVIELASVFDCVFVFDNTDSISLESVFKPIENVYYLTNLENRGLSFAFNAIFEEAIKKEIDFLCTLDQDSTFKKEDIFAIEEKIVLLYNSDTSIGIIAPYIDYGTKPYSLSDTLIDKKSVITSGSFVNVAVYKKGDVYYDDNYFIDKFEIDFCKQLITKGYRILMYYGSVLHQELGVRNKKNHINHNAIRHYYLFRNRLYFNKKWYPFIKRVVLDFLQSAKHIYRILRFEEERKDKIRILKRAIRDYKNNKMGKALFDNSPNT